MSSYFSICQIEAEGVVDIDGAIVKARNQRMKLVQTKV